MNSGKTVIQKTLEIYLNNGPKSGTVDIVDSAERHLKRVAGVRHLVLHELVFIVQSAERRLRPVEPGVERDVAAAGSISSIKPKGN